MTAIYANPLDFPEVWDFIVAAGHVSPGRAEVSKARKHYEWDVKKGPGIRGATETYRGQPPQAFDVKLTFWERFHFDMWGDFQPVLEYDPTKKTVKAIDILHPALVQLGIHAAVCTDIGQIVHEGKGEFSVSLSFLEYLPPGKKSASSTPSGSSANSGSSKKGAAPPAPTAKTAQEQEIDKLLAEAKKP